jgi:hypothetical protein
VFAAIEYVYLFGYLVDIESVSIAVGTLHYLAFFAAFFLATAFFFAGAFFTGFFITFTFSDGRLFNSAMNLARVGAFFLSSISPNAISSFFNI